MEIARDYPMSLWGGIKERKLFEDINTYFMFIGYPRSGHSLVGSLLDAHPNMIVGHELNTLKYILAGFRRRQIYYLLLKSSQAYTERGRDWYGYSYEVPDQWQGRFEKLQIIGDKKGAGSTLALRSHPSLLKRLRKTLNISVKFIHAVRNPYDNISSIYGIVRIARPRLEDSIDYYFSLCETVSEIKKQLKSNDMFELRHEAFVDDPENLLIEICSFLGGNAPNDYLKECASIVTKPPRKTRYLPEWDNELIHTVKERMAEFPFLEGYSYED